MVRSVVLERQTNTSGLHVQTSFDWQDSLGGRSLSYVLSFGLEENVKS